MASPRRGVQSIKTMGAMVDNRRVRTPAGALLEMSAMANEKLLLQKELQRWKRRHAEIDQRLKAIAAKERSLMTVIQGDQMPPGIHNSTGENLAANTDTATPAWAVKPVPMQDAQDGTASRFKVQELSY